MQRKAPGDTLAALSYIHTHTHTDIEPGCIIMYIDICVEHFTPPHRHMNQLNQLNQLVNFSSFFLSLFHSVHKHWFFSSIFYSFVSFLLTANESHTHTHETIEQAAHLQINYNLLHFFLSAWFTFEETCSLFSRNSALVYTLL